MCRRELLCGFMLLAFGLGMLIGIWLEGGFLCHCVALGFVVAGGCICRRK